MDVGGGHEMLLRGILSANSRLHGILAHLPSIVAGATALRTGSVADRCEIAGIDFFQAIPEGETRISRNQSSMIGTISTLSGS